MADAGNQWTGAHTTVTWGSLVLGTDPGAITKISDLVKERESVKYTAYVSATSPLADNSPAYTRTRPGAITIQSVDIDWIPATAAQLATIEADFAFGSIETLTIETAMAATAATAKISQSAWIKKIGYGKSTDAVSQVSLTFDWA